MTMKAIVCAIDIIVAISCMLAAVADGTERKMRIIELIVSAGMVANVYMIWSM